MVFEKLLADPAVKQNVIFLIVGIMMGIFLSIVRNYMNDSENQNPGAPQAAKAVDGDSDWEDESEEDDASNANVEQSPEKDKALSDQFPIDDVKMMLAVRTDLGMTKGKIGA